MSEKTPFQVITAKIDALMSERGRLHTQINLLDARIGELEGVKELLAEDDDREETTRLPPGEIERRVTELLRNDGLLRRMTEDQIVQATGFKRNSLRAALKRMVEAKTIESHGDGYQIVAAPDSPPGRPQAPNTSLTS